MKLKLNANVIVTNSKGQLLVVKLGRGQFKGGLCIPGGGVEPGELSLDTARREVLEETGIEISDVRPFGFCELLDAKNDDQRVVLLFEAKGEGTPVKKEHDTPHWIDLEEAQRVSIPFTREALRPGKKRRAILC